MRPPIALLLLCLLLCHCVSVPGSGSPSAQDSPPDDSAWGWFDAGWRDPAADPGPPAVPCSNMAEHPATAVDGSASDAPAWFDPAGADGGAGPDGAPPHDAAVVSPTITAGDVVFSEVMPNPAALPDTQGEWFELIHAGSPHTYDLSGCVLGAGGGSPHVIGEPMPIGPGQLRTFARTSSPGFEPDHIHGFTLVNSGGELSLLCDGVEIDRLRYDARFPLQPGVSMSLDPSRTGSDHNDDPDSWCPARGAYGGDLGSPGEPNPPCGDEDADAGSEVSL